MAVFGCKFKKLNTNPIQIMLYLSGFADFGQVLSGSGCLNILDPDLAQMWKGPGSGIGSVP
jgi:hypothetical protein